MAATPTIHAQNRIRSEFLEMPGLSLKPEQVQRLCGFDREVCERALEALVKAAFLTTRGDGSYIRSSPRYSA
jgi:hypothetical protein